MLRVLNASLCGQQSGAQKRGGGGKAVTSAPLLEIGGNYGKMRSAGSNLQASPIQARSMQEVRSLSTGG